MRRALLAFVALLVLLVGAVFSLPFLFRDRLVEAARAELDRRLDATVTLEDADVTVLSSFPDLTVELQGLTLTGKDPFAGIELARLSRLSLTVDLASVLGGDTLVVRGVEVGEGAVVLIVDADGRANYTLMPPSEDDGSPSPTLDLHRAVVEGLDISYEDRTSGLSAKVDALGLDLRARVGDGSTATAGRIGANGLTVVSGGVGWLQQVRVDTALDVTIDDATGKITLRDTSIGLNSLKLGVAGSVTPVGADTDLDLALSAPGADFKALLSLVPAVYQKDFAGLTASGTLGLSGTVKGRYLGEGDGLPALDLAMRIEDGSFRYPDLPGAVTDVQVAAGITHPGGPTDLLVVDVSRFHLALAGAPVDGRLKLKHPTTDPEVDLALTGKLDLQRLAEIVPPDPGTSMTGQVAVDLALAGRVSDFEAQRMDAVSAAGTIAMAGVHYRDAELPEEIIIEKLQVSIDPRAFDMADLTVRFGRSDLRASGRLDNVLAYALTDEPLVGRMDIKSSLLDLGPYMNDDEEAVDDSGESSLVAVPTNLDLVLDANLGRVLTDVYDLQDVRGTLVVKDGVVRLERVRADTLGGQVELSGTYAAPTDQRADVDMAVTVRTMDVSQTAKTVATVRQIAPIAEKATGRFSSTVSVKARLQPDLSPEIQSLDSSGGLQALGVSVEPTFLAALSEQLKMPALNKMQLGDAGLRFAIKEGRLDLGDTTVKLGDTKARLRGGTGILDETLDLRLDFDLPVGQIQAAGMAGQLASAVAPGGKVPVAAKIGGTYDKPKIALDLSATTAAVGDVVNAAVDQAKAQVLDQAQQGLDKLVEEARKAGDKLVAEAQSLSDKAVAEAKKQGDKLRSEAKKQGDKLVADAKGNPLKETAAKEAAKKLRQEADKQATRLENEAKKTGEAGVTKAKGQRDKMIADAEAKAKLK